MSAQESAILARFTFADRAEAVRDALRAHGFDVIDIRRPEDEQPPAGPTALVEWGRYGYALTSLDDKWTSAASWDNALNLNLGEAVLLTAVVPKDRADEVRRIIRDGGGII